jgi:hypothetical protein
MTIVFNGAVGLRKMAQRRPTAEPSDRSDNDAAPSPQMRRWVAIHINLTFRPNRVAL